MAKTTKKNNKEEMMEHNHAMMHHGMKAKGIVYIVVGLIFAYLAYTWNPVLVTALVTLGIGIWFLSMGAMKLGWNYGMMGCGCGCSCGSGCNCEWEDK